LGELAEIAFEYFRSSGFRYDYNDGCYDRWSGYSLSSGSFSVPLAKALRATAREKMLEMACFGEKLAQMEVGESKAADRVLVNLSVFKTLERLNLNRCRLITSRWKAVNRVKIFVSRLYIRIYAEGSSFDSYL
jgi:hypothetical protein